MNDWLSPLPEPQDVWSRFLELNRVPRPSKNEQAAIEHLRSWALGLGFEARSDVVGNLVVHVPKTDRSQGEGPIVILQCHVDIVAVTSPEIGQGDRHRADAARGIIPIVRGDVDPSHDKRLIPKAQGDWVNAPFTTLGADNGIGVAMMMALAQSNQRPVALQLLFTIDEEAGMTGAGGLDPAALGLSGKMLINIDTEDDTEVTIGAAGGRDCELRWQGDSQSLSTHPTNSKLYRLAVRNLKGGHSGVEINQGRANANRLVARALARASASSPGMQLLGFQGGSRRNAIPDVCEATLAMDASHESDVRATLENFSEELNQLFANRDNTVRIEFQPATGTQAAADKRGLSVASTSQFIDMLLSIPTGICEMTPELPILVESSCNLAIVSLEPSGLAQVVCSVRGTTAAALNDICDSIGSIAKLTSASTKISDGYPGWKPRLESKLLQVVVSEYQRLFGSQPKVHAVHAGLECGLLLEKLPQLEAVSIGPTIKGNHAVGERVQISSVAKSYHMLKAILAALST